MPWILLSTSFPLPRNPPTPNLLWHLRINEIKDHDNVAYKTLCCRRDIRISAIKTVAVNPLSLSSPLSNKPWIFRSTYVIYSQTTPKILGTFHSLTFMIDKHYVVGNPDLMRVPSDRHFYS
jgi:hypothetical protein